MLKKRKAQGLSINTIILVVIGLIVLVIIIAILTGRMGLFSKGLESSASCENTCNALNKEASNSPSAGGNCAAGEWKVGEGCCCKPKTPTPTPTPTPTGDD